MNHRPLVPRTRGETIERLARVAVLAGARDRHAAARQALRDVAEPEGLLGSGDGGGGRDGAAPPRTASATALATARAEGGNGPGYTGES